MFNYKGTERTNGYKSCHPDQIMAGFVIWFSQGYCYPAEVRVYKHLRVWKTPLWDEELFDCRQQPLCWKKNNQSHLIGECTIFEESRFHFHGHMSIRQNLDWTVIKQDDFFCNFFWWVHIDACLSIWTVNVHIGNVSIFTPAMYFATALLHQTEIKISGWNSVGVGFVLITIHIVLNITWYLVSLAFSLKDWGVRIWDIFVAFLGDKN